MTNGIWLTNWVSKLLFISTIVINFIFYRSKEVFRQKSKRSFFFSFNERKMMRNKCIYHVKNITVIDKKNDHSKTHFVKMLFICVCLYMFMFVHVHHDDNTTTHEWRKRTNPQRLKTSDNGI